MDIYLWSGYSKSLANLFEEIDLNGNGVLEWEEFTNYIIEKATVLNNIKTKQRWNKVVHQE